MTRGSWRGEESDGGGEELSGAVVGGGGEGSRRPPYLLHKREGKARSLSEKPRRGRETKEVEAEEQDTCTRGLAKICIRYLRVMKQLSPLLTCTSEYHHYCCNDSQWKQ